MKKDSTLELYIMRHCVPRQEIFKWGQVKTEIHLPTKKVDLIFFSALVLINEYDATKVKQVLNGQLPGIYYLPMGEL